MPPVPQSVSAAHAPPGVTGGSAQEPFVQIFPPVHVVPQPPQLALSVFSLTHAVPHFVWPLPQFTEHAPEMQLSPDGHACPHVLQLAALD
jgi:hypothetical protein